jgi:protein gp37
MGNTSIQWTDKTWSPLRARVRQDAATIAREKGYESLRIIAQRMAGHVGPHCERVSAGCDHCYSETNNERCLPANGTGLPFDRRARDLVEAFVDEKILAQPLHWKKPQRIFVENQSDLFGEWNADEMIDRVLAVMALCPQHMFQVLTKRSLQMREYLSSQTIQSRIAAFQWEIIENRVDPNDRRSDDIRATALDPDEDWPLPNLWLGVSVEDQQRADERIPLLLQTPAAVRFVSYEPAVGPVILQPGWLRGVPMSDGSRINWTIVGGESGPGARPFNLQWARDVIRQCQDAAVAVFFKQAGARPYYVTHASKTVEVRLKDRKGGDLSELPPDLNVREFPNA